MIFIILLVLLAGVLGFIFGKIYFENNSYVKVDGLWVRNSLSHLSNYTGNFICINTDGIKDMKRLTEVVWHEVGHEIFSNICEKNITKCIDLAG